MKTNFILSPNSYDLISSQKFSAEFKQTAFLLIQEFKNQSLRSFLKEKFEISEKEFNAINVKFKESFFQSAIQGFLRHHFFSGSRSQPRTHFH